jgi:hypothetical protein
MRLIGVAGTREPSLAFRRQIETADERAASPGQRRLPTTEKRGRYNGYR